MPIKPDEICTKPKPLAVTKEDLELTMNRTSSTFGDSTDDFSILH